MKGGNEKKGKNYLRGKLNRVRKGKGHPVCPTGKGGGGWKRKGKGGISHKKEYSQGAGREFSRERADQKALLFLRGDENKAGISGQGKRSSKALWGKVQDVRERRAEGTGKKHYNLRD